MPGDELMGDRSPKSVSEDMLSDAEDGDSDGLAVYLGSTNRRPMRPGASWPAAVSCSPCPCLLRTLRARTPARRFFPSLCHPLALIKPPPVCLLLLLFRLHTGVLRHGFPVQFLELLRVPQAHLQHLRLSALLEVSPGRQVDECRHSEAFRAGPCHIRQTVLSSRLIFRSSGEVNDDTLFHSQALRFVDGERKADTHLKHTRGKGQSREGPGQQRWGVRAPGTVGASTPTGRRPLQARA